MHRLTWILAAAAACTGLVSCSARLAPESTESPLSFSATIESPAITKTELQVNGSIFWNPSDSIAVFRGNTGKGLFISANTAPAATAKFTGSIQGDPGNGDWWAVQPYSDDAACDGESVTISIPAAQTALADGFAPGMFPSVARTSDNSLEFKNICGGLRFTLKKSGITSVSISSNGGEPLAGRVKVSFGSDGKPSVNVLESSTTVTINAVDGFQPGKWYYMSLLPGELSGGFTISITKDKDTVSRQSVEPVSITRSTIGQIAEVDSDMEFKKSISILAIGNSFSVDAMHYLWQMLKELGYDEIVLGNLYYGGCSLESHMGFIDSGSSSYTYYTNSNGTWATNNGFKAIDAVSERKWDWISMQQSSNNSGIASSYDPYLGQLVSFVKANCPEARLMWHMTWAYQEGSTHSAFPNYNSDQMTMYNAIISAVNAKITSNDAFSMVIPSGTAIQNMRTSYIGDNLTRDGYHMSYNIGRMVTAMMWAREISGEDISNVSFTPSTYSYSSKLIAAMRDAVNSAHEHPFQVTESSYGRFDSSYKANTELQEAFTAAGYKLSDYTELPFSVTCNAYYNSSAKTSLTTTFLSPAILICKDNCSSAANLSQFCATGIFSKEEIPVGSVIVLKNGWQYRPEGWTKLTVWNGTSSGYSGIARPGAVSTGVVKVDDAWWGKFNYRAFNISKSGNPTLTGAELEQAASSMAIFIPRN